MRMKVIWLAIPVALTVTMFLPMKGQQQDRTPSPKDKSLEERIAQLPVTDFVVQEPKDPEKKFLRQKRNNRHNLSNSVEGGARVLNESMEPVLLDLPLSDQPEEPAIPIRNSDTIVVGSITDENAYISSDRTNVYSEVSVKVEEVLKADPRYPLAPGFELDAERRGGAVRFPSGKILRRASLGRNIPRRGHRYLLFLTYNEESQDFSIVTGYELLDQHVLPLDGMTGGGGFRQFGSYERYRGIEEGILVNDVRTAISKQERSGNEEGQ